jgi:hypothetical protein
VFNQDNLDYIRTSFHISSFKLDTPPASGGNAFNWVNVIKLFPQKVYLQDTIL